MEQIFIFAGRDKTNFKRSSSPHRASERNFFRGSEDRSRAPKIREKEEEQIKKRCSLKFGPVFCPNLGKEQKKRSSLKFGPVFCPNLAEEEKKKGRHSNLVLFFAQI